MTDLLTALALVLVIEGVVYAAIPDAMKRVVTQMLSLPNDRLRIFGLAMAATGVAMAWVIRS